MAAGAKTGRSDFVGIDSVLGGVLPYDLDRAIGKTIYINETNRRRNALFFEVIRKCCESPEPVIIDQDLSDGSNAHIFIRRVSVNPVTKVVALAAVILAVSDIK